jgi:hypothetical protein
LELSSAASLGIPYRHIFISSVLAICREEPEIGSAKKDLITKQREYSQANDARKFDKSLRSRRKNETN